MECSARTLAFHYVSERRVHFLLKILESLDIQGRHFFM